MLPGVAGRCSEGLAGERPVITMGRGGGGPGPRLGEESQEP